MNGKIYAGMASDPNNEGALVVVQGKDTHHAMAELEEQLKAIEPDAKKRGERFPKGFWKIVPVICPDA